MAFQTAGRVTQGFSAEELSQYHDDGFVVRRALFSPEEIRRFDARFVELIANPPGPPMQIMRDVMVVKGAVEPESDVHAVNKLFSFEDDPVLSAYSNHATLTACLASLFEESVFSVSTNVFNKPPGVDGRHPFHQDLRYYRIRPADAIVGTWTALRPATRDTGCLAVLPGSHKQGLLEHGYPDWEYVNHGFFSALDVDWSDRVHVVLEPGDTLFFHPLLLHGSGRNRSSDFRRAISAHFVAGSAESTGKPWRDNPLVRQVV